jgi:hypothetical protein
MSLSFHSSIELVNRNNQTQSHLGEGIHLLGRTAPGFKAGGGTAAHSAGFTMRYMCHMCCRKEKSHAKYTECAFP